MASSLVLLDSIEPTMKPLLYAHVIAKSGVGPNAKSEDLFGEWVDANGNGIVDSGEIGALTTWTSGTVQDIVKIDYGDVLVLKAFLQYNQAQFCINQAYNYDVNIAAEAKVTQRTKESFLKDYPGFGTLATSSSICLGNGRACLIAAIDYLLQALNVKAAETGDQKNNLITVDTARVPEARQQLNDIRSSIGGSATTFYEGGKQLTLNLGNLFSGVSLRAMIPPVSGDNWAGLLPDPTVGGIFSAGIYNFAGDNLNQDVKPANGIPDILE